MARYTRYGKATASWTSGALVTKGHILHCHKTWCGTITHSACQSAEGWARASVSSHCTSGAFSQLNCSWIHPGFPLQQILRIQRHSSLGNFLQKNCFWNLDEFERIVYSRRMLYHGKKSCFKGIIQLCCVILFCYDRIFLLWLILLHFFAFQIHLSEVRLEDLSILWAGFLRWDSYCYPALCYRK